MPYGSLNKANENKMKLEEKNITEGGLGEEEIKLIEATKQLEETKKILKEKEKALTEMVDRASELWEKNKK
jgi:hypothetical protein